MCVAILAWFYVSCHLTCRAVDQQQVQGSFVQRMCYNYILADFHMVISQDVLIVILALFYVLLALILA